MKNVSIVYGLKKKLTFDLLYIFVHSTQQNTIIKQHSVFDIIYSLARRFFIMTMALRNIKISTSLWNHKEKNGWKWDNVHLLQFTDI